MEIVNNKKKSMASKMRISPHLLAKLAHKGGKIGKLAAAFDSWQSRTLDKGKGVYNRADWEK